MARLITIAFVIGVALASSALAQETECDCVCEMKTVRSVVMDTVENGKNMCTTVDRSNVKHCYCNVGGTDKCVVQRSKRWSLKESGVSQGECEEIDSITTSYARPSTCEAKDRCYRMIFNETTTFTARPVIIDTSTVKAWRYRWAEATGVDFKEGLRDFWVTLRFVYSTKTDSTSICGIYGEGKRNPAYYERTRGSSNRHWSRTDATIVNSYAMTYEMLDGEGEDRYTQGVQKTLESHNNWVNEKTDGWCAGPIESTEDMTIVLSNMVNIAGVLLNSRASDTGPSTPVVSGEYHFDKPGRDAYAKIDNRAHFDKYGASLLRYPQVVEINFETVCGC